MPIPPPNPGKLSSWAGHNHDFAVNIHLYLRTSFPPITIEGFDFSISNVFHTASAGTTVQLIEADESVYIGCVQVQSSQLVNAPYVSIGNNGISTNQTTYAAQLNLTGFFCGDSAYGTMDETIALGYSYLAPFEAESRFDFDSELVLNYIDNTQNFDIAFTMIFEE